MESILTVVGIETINAKSGGTFYKVYIQEEIPSLKKLNGYRVKDYFVTFVPQVEVGDVVDLVFGCGYDAKAYLKDIKKI